MRKVVFLVVPALVIMFLSAPDLDAARGRYYRQKKKVEQQKLPEEKVMAIDSRLKKARQQLNYLKSKNIVTDDIDSERKAIESEFDSLKSNYTGKDISLSAQKIEGGINLIEIKIKNMIDIEKRLSLMYLLMLVFGFVIITGVLFYYFRMYSKRKV